MTSQAARSAPAPAPAPAARRRGRGRNHTSDRIVAVGLASATCLGLVGVVGVRSAQARSLTEAMVPAASIESVTPSGLTRSDLTSWEAELKAEQARLTRYQHRLSAAAVALNRDVLAYNGAVKARAATAQLAARQSPSIPTYSGGSSSGGSSGGSSSGAVQAQPVSNSRSSG